MSKLFLAELVFSLLILYNTFVYIYNTYTIMDLVVGRYVIIWTMWSVIDRRHKKLFRPSLQNTFCVWAAPEVNFTSHGFILTVNFIIVILYNQSQESCFYYSVFNNSYWYLVFRMPMFVDTELSCDILFRGRAFALISEKDKFHVMYFQPMKITKLLSYVI